MIRVIICESGKEASVKEIDNSLESLQSIVEGHIETFYPFSNDMNLCVICNEEGKFNGCLPNRVIYSDCADYKYNEIVDIIFGTFIICDASGDDFGSLSDEQLSKAVEKFKYPNKFQFFADGRCEVSN